MASDDSWNVKGLKPELRETAREAARRRGLSVNEWLQSVILQSAEEEERDSPAPVARARRDERNETPDTDIESGMQAIGARLDELTRQLDTIARAGSEKAQAKPAPAAAPVPVPPAPAPAAPDISSTLRSIEGRLAALSANASAASAQPAAPQLDDTLSRLDRRLDRLMHEGRASSTELERRIAAVDRALARLNDQPAAPVAAAPVAPAPAAQPKPAAPATTDWTAGLDHVVAEIAERQRMLDADAGASPLHAQFTALSQRLEAPSATAQPAPAQVAAASETQNLHDQLRILTDELRSLRRPGGIEDAISDLRRELVEIGRKLADAAPRRAVQALEAEVSTLSERVDQNRGRGVDASALANVEGALDEIRHALRQLAPAESLAAFREEVRALDQRIEAITTQGGNAMSGAALRHLEQAVSELRGIAAHAASGEALIALAEEVQAIGDKVDRFVSASPQVPAALSSVLEQRFEELAAHLDARASAAAAVPQQLGVMVEQIADKLERVDLGRDNASLLDAIARQVTRLTEYAEATDARFETLGQFERAIRSLLDGMDDLRASTVSTAERVARETVLHAAPQGQPVELDSLRHNIDTLRQSQVQSDQRTQDTLEAVHDTLERLVDRLALVETDLRGDRPTQSAGRPLEMTQAPSLAPAAPQPAMTPPASGGRAAVAEAGTAVMAPTVPERRPIDPTLPADHPLEPGTALRGRASSAAERIAASEAALGAAKPVTESDAKSNFIAAARRAAQAAANMTPAAPAAAEGEKQSTSAFAALAKRFTGRRALMLGVILLIGAGALHLSLNGFGGLIGGKSSEPAPAAATTPPPERPTGSFSATRPAPTAAAPTATPTPSLPVQAAPPPAPDLSSAASPPRHESRTVPSVSPLTIASIQLPTGDLTGAVGRATGLNARPAANRTAAAPVVAPDELPPAFSKLLRTAALSGDPAAEYEVALRYLEGRGTAISLEQASRWFERAANRGLAPAQYRLGSLYEKGHGVRKDLDQARRLYRAAADQGHAKAMHNLAVLYAEGIDGKPDFKVAAEWFRKAALRGVPDSQYNLGILHARGLGVEQNLSESFKWFALAAQQGDQDAGKKRDDVAARLDQQALIAARMAAQTFVAEPQPEEANVVKTPPGGWDQVTAPKAPSKAKPVPRRQAASAS